MHEENFQKVKLLQYPERYSLVLAIFISVVLLVAAVGKFLHPIEYFKTFDRFVSLFELIGVCVLLSFRYHRLTWIGSTLLFSLWMGYAFFWHWVELPCGCMGAKLQLPTIFTLALDGVLLAASAYAAFLFGIKKDLLFVILLVSALFSLVGFAFAEWVYKYFVLSLRFT